MDRKISYMRETERGRCDREREREGEIREEKRQREVLGLVGEGGGACPIHLYVIPTSKTLIIMV